jgi:hypothetical protein
LAGVLLEFQATRLRLVQAAQLTFGLLDPIALSLVVRRRALLQDERIKVHSAALQHQSL